MELLEKKAPRPEYPRPQFFRDSWQTLNGEWDFEFDFSLSGEARGLFKEDTPFTRKIRVPFCPESELSGIGFRDFMAGVWYRRKINEPAGHPGGRVLLHFGAVDYVCKVWVNGNFAGSHIGGYSSFTLDITRLLREGENTLTVFAQDDTRSGRQPRGKQSGEYFSHGCDYTRTTGIWQTVWLESVPAQYLAGVRVAADGKNGTVSVRAKVEGRTDGLSLHITASYGGRKAGEKTVLISARYTDAEVPVSEVHFWNVLNPELYDLKYELMRDGEVLDTVKSYFGFRTVELKDGAICINGKPVFQRLVLDQGFYPDGIYTAPSDEALKKDIELSISLGFNGARLHQKIFEERFLYWADRLGYIVWGEHANWGMNTSDASNTMNFLPEWLEAVDRDFNHPAIVGWCPFNETWESIPSREPGNNIISVAYYATKAADPTRPVIDSSGFRHYVTDVYDVHDYEQDPEVFNRHYGGMPDGEVYDPFLQNKGFPFPPSDSKYKGQPFFVSEYGGIRWSAGGSGWGYGKGPKSEEEYAARYEGLTRALLRSKRVCAFCYTQLYDVEQEQNGLVTYGRKKKFSDETYRRIRSANLERAAIEK